MPLTCLAAHPRHLHHEADESQELPQFYQLRPKTQYLAEKIELFKTNSAQIQPELKNIFLNITKNQIDQNVTFFYKK